jgi:uncharacterized protein YndB with AHSA1/START domain
MTMSSDSTRQDDLGEILRDGDRTGLRFVRRYGHPIDRVWAALTESDQLRAWMPTDIVGDRREGAEVKLSFWPAQVEKYGITETELTGRIQVWDPPRTFQWTWGDDVLRFELSAEGDVTTLRFTTWLAEGDREATGNTAAGYHICLHALRVWLDTGVAEPLTEHDHLVVELEPAYAEVARP